MASLCEEEKEEVEVINLTPHPVIIFHEEVAGRPIEDVPKTVYEKGTEIPRCHELKVPRKPLKIKGHPTPIPVSKVEYDAVSPIPTTTPGKVFIVSGLVAQAMCHRKDLFYPGTVIRDEKGDAIGCEGLYCAFKEEEINKVIEIYTDGACHGNGTSSAVAGIGVFLGHDDPRNISMPLDMPPHTNNRAELQAIKHALNIVEKEKPLKAIIYSDSKYSIDCLSSYIINWKRNGWKTAKGQPVLNKDLIIPLDQQLTQLKKTIQVEFVHVRGHTGLRDGNYEADLLANNGIHMSGTKRQRID